MDDVDRSLLRRVAAGDQRAFEELYARHGQPLLAYAEGLLSDRGRAEEALQDTFLALWRSVGAFEGRSTVRTWLFGICRRQALGRIPGRRPAALPMEAAAEVPTGEPGPEAVVLARADARAVAGALAELAPAHREVLDLAFGAALAHAEIAEVLGIPVGTVKSRLFHARALLARALPAETDRTVGTDRTAGTDPIARTGEAVGTGRETGGGTRAAVGISGRKARR